MPVPREEKTCEPEPPSHHHQPPFICTAVSLKPPDVCLIALEILSSRFQESVATNGVEIGVVQQKLLMLLQAKNKLKLLRFRDSSDQSQRKGETVDQTEDFSMEICQGTAAVFVCDQPGGETILVDQMIVDRSKPGGYGQRTYRTTFLPEGSKV
uniref:Uncharacterized protein n=2 Tax=Brassica oleracea TaxID=3712 RepID=A0A0D3E099_BRAOL